MNVLFVVILWFVSGLEECSKAPSHESDCYTKPKNCDQNPYTPFFQPFFHTLTSPTNL